MKVKELYEMYNKIATDKMKNEWLANHVKINKYIGYATKVAAITAAVAAANIRDGRYIKDTPKTDMLFDLCMFSMYTDVEVEEKNETIDYDLLIESGLYDDIYGMIDEKESSRCAQLRMCIERDIEHNATSNYALLDKVMGAMSTAVDAFSEQITEEE